MNLASSPELVKEKVVVNEAKLRDVFSLLQNRFGAYWKSDKRLNYFLPFFKGNFKLTDKAQKQESKDAVDDGTDESDCCSCCGEDDEETLFV